MSTYYPTGFRGPYFKANGSYALNYYLKFYVAGTTTPLSVAPNKTATDINSQPQLLDKVRINERGYSVNPTGGEIDPHIDQTFKVIFYKNAVDANANNSSAAEWTIDNLSPGLIGFANASAAVAASEVTYIAADTATQRFLGARVSEMLSVTDFDADPLGAVDATTAFATAQLEGLDIFVPSGTYLMDGISVLRDNQNFYFGGDVILKAANNNKVMFKQTSSGCRHYGKFTVNSNSKSGVYGMQIGPSDLTDTSTVVNQINNTLPGIIGDSGVEELVVIQCGPDVSSTNSICEGNTLPSVIGEGARRLVWFKSPANSGALTPAKNLIHLVKGNDDSNTCNTLVDIEAGTDNTIVALFADGLSSGTTPNTTPTALKVDASCSVTSLANDNNSVLSGNIAGCDLDVHNANATTKTGGLSFDYDNSTLTEYPVNFGALQEAEKMHFGHFASGATWVKQPKAWTVAYNGSGLYTVTHNLGDTDYIVIAGVENNNASAELSGRSTTAFDIQVKEHNSSTALQLACHFILIRY